MKDFTVTVTEKHLDATLESKKTDPYFNLNICKSCMIAKAIEELFPDSRYVSMGISILQIESRFYECTEARKLTVFVIAEINREIIKKLVPLTLKFVER